MQDKASKLSIGKSAKYLGVSIDTVRRWGNKEKLSSYRSPGGHRYFLKEDLDSVFNTKYSRPKTESNQPKPIIEDIKSPQEVLVPEIKNSEDRLNEILSKNPEKKWSLGEKVVIFGLILFLVVDLILVSLWYFSTRIISPIP